MKKKCCADYTVNESAEVPCMRIGHAMKNHNLQITADIFYSETVDAPIINLEGKIYCAPD
jgi:hypothetical protein